MNSKILELCALPGPSGDESIVRKYIQKIVEKYADSIHIDALGNIVCEKRGLRRSSKKIMLCAHMDEVGVIVTHITDAGYLKFAALGGIDKRVLLGKRVKFANATGIIGTRPIHLTPRAAREKSVDINEMYIDIGATSKDQALRYVSLGETGVFDEKAFIQNEHLFTKAIDDRFGCAMLLELITNELPVDITFAFTVQEEVGTRGAQVAANFVKPDVAIVVEATTAADLPGVPEAKKVCKLGGGAVVPFMDGGTIYDRELWELITNVANKNGVKWQTKEYISGGTDASAIQRSGIGVQTAGIAAPVRNLHSPVSVANVTDMQEVLTLLRVVLNELANICMIE